MPPRRQQHKQQQQQQRAPKKAWGRPSAGQSNETGQSGQGAVKGKPKSAAKKQKNRDLSPLADALLGQLDPPRVREYIPRDGSCLFRCVASRVRGTALQGQQVREACVKHMAANSDDFAPFLLDDTPFDHYVYEMSRPKTWGGNLEIQAMSVVYQTNFVIFSLAEGRDGDDESASLVENVIDNGFEDTIELVLYGNHYDVIHAEGKFDLMRTIQSMVYDLVDAAVERSADAKARVLAGSKGEVEKEQEAVVFWSDDSKHSFKPISWERWLTRRQAQFDQDAAMAKETHGKAAEFERLSGYYRKHMETQRDRKSGGGGRPRKTKDVLILTGNKVGRDAADDTAAEPDFVNPDELDATDGFDFPSLPPDVGDRKLSTAITASLASDPNPAGPSGQLAGIFRTVTGSDAISEGVRITAAMSDEADDAAAGSGATGDSVAAPDEGVQKGGEAGVDSSAETEAQHDGAHQETSGNGADNSATISPSPAPDPKPASAAPKASAWGQKLVIGRSAPKATPKAKAAVGPKAKAKHAPAAKRAGGPKKSAGTKAPAAKKMTSAQLKERGGAARPRCSEHRAPACAPATQGGA